MFKRTPVHEIPDTPNDERKYYLSNLPADATLKVLASAIKARWVCEQAHQQMKEDLVSITSKADHGKDCTDTL